MDLIFTPFFELIQPIPNLRSCYIHSYLRVIDATFKGNLYPWKGF